ncbi:MAG: NAD(P)-dependent oxidoreductase [Rhodospirillales bacterium]|nr:NAD(P)-dependent oxidoreductase [Rhodospirillales bacterium]
MKPRIGFIGLGIMGAPMAGHLLAAGYTVTIANRSRGAAVAALLAGGAAWAESPAALAAQSDIIIRDGLIANAKPGTLLIDMTTSSPGLAQLLAREAAAHGLGALDAPVSGGEAGARNAGLSIMLGGDAADLARALSVFETLGKNIRHMGGPGAGQHTKMANQIAIASTLMGVAESMAYARAAGLEGSAVLEALGPGAAGSFQLAMLGPKMIAQDFAPGFMLKHFIKDLGIALAEAEGMGLALPGLAQARRLAEMAAATTGDDAGTQAIIAALVAS